MERKRYARRTPMKSIRAPLHADHGGASRPHHPQPRWLSSHSNKLYAYPQVLKSGGPQRACKRVLGGGRLAKKGGLGATASESELHSRAVKTVRMPVPPPQCRTAQSSKEFSIREYLKSAEAMDRLVHVVFSDEKRRKKLTEGEYEVSLLPVKLLNIAEFGVVCVLLVDNTTKKGEAHKHRDP